MIENFIIETAIKYLFKHLEKISKEDPIKNLFCSGSVAKRVSVTEFYDDPEVQKPGAKVKICGTFSNYIPLLPGKARHKRDLHLEFRKKIEGIKERFHAQNHRMYESTINYLLSLSSGQMVLRMPKFDGFYVPCAIYESIARNSVLLLVEREVYDDMHSKLISLQTVNKDFAEMEVEGQVHEFDNQFLYSIRQIMLEMKGVADIVDLRKLECLLGTKALYLRKENAKYRYIGPARFLDGDIWVAIKSNCDEELITRFLNLSDKEELAEQRRSIIDELKYKYQGWSIIKGFDSSIEQFI